MSQDLFTDVVSPTVRVRSSSRYTLAVSIVVHALVVAAVVIVPLMASGALPQVTGSVIGDYMPVAPTPPPPPMPQQAPPQRVAERINHDAAPTEMPDKIVEEVPRPPAVTSDSAIGSIDVGQTSSAFGSGPNIGVTAAAPDPPPPPQPQKPVRPGGLIREPVKTRHVPPLYPQIAIAARVSGTVVIDAVIGTDGTVREARVLSSNSTLLNQAALEAVRQWRYTPTTGSAISTCR